MFLKGKLFDSVFHIASIRYEAKSGDVCPEDVYPDKQDNSWMMVSVFGSHCQIPVHQNDIAGISATGIVCRQNSILIRGRCFIAT